MLFPDWVAITVLVLLLVGAASAWIRQHKSALMQQTKKPRFSKRTAEESRDWSYAKDRIGQQLKAHYQALATEELPPRFARTSQKVRRRNGTFSKLGRGCAVSDRLRCERREAASGLWTAILPRPSRVLCAGRRHS